MKKEKITDNKKKILFLLLFFIIIFFYYHAPEQIGEFLLNDNNTAVYSVYARTLIDFPSKTTKFLMAEIGPDGLPLIENPANKYDYYINHPPFLVWTLAILYKIFGYNLIIGRSISIISSCLFFLILSIFLKNKIKNGKLYFITLIFIISFPIFFTHGLIIEHQPLLNLTLMISSIFFLNINKNKNLFTFGFILFWSISLLIDWPAYLFVIPYLIILIKKRKFKLIPIIIFLPVFFYLLLNFYHNYLTNNLNLTNFFGLNILLERSFTNLFPDKDFFKSWVVSLFKMTYLFVHFNYQILASILFMGSCFIIVKNYKKNNEIQNLFIIFLIPSTMYMLMFRQWADSHSYWSYYFIIPVSLSLPIVYNHTKKKIKYVILIFILVSASVNVYNTSTYLYEQKTNPLSKETLDFLEKYKNFYYVTDDDSIGFGFGFRNRWIENKKFHSLNSFDFKNKNNILFIKRINNCKLDQSFKKIDFFNYCYKEILK
jgi:hypothetical protein